MTYRYTEGRCGAAVINIFVLDEDTVAAEKLAAIIEQAIPEAEVESFTDGRECVRYAKVRVPDIVFLEIRMETLSGLQAAQKLQQINPRVNIIFATEYDEYARDAFAMHASGFITKPVTEEKILFEFEHLRYPMEKEKGPGIRVRTFGNFEVFCGNEVINFKYSKSKEVFAYLVDRLGAMVAKDEIIAVIWEDSKPGEHDSYFRNIRSDLLRTFDKYGARDVLATRWGYLGVVPSLIECDYYDYLKEDKRNPGKKSGILLRQYRGEYMSQYSWSEATNSSLRQAYNSLS